MAERYRRVRATSEELTRGLATEDFVAQSMPDASPVKWNLAHTTWFFETFVLRATAAAQEPLHPGYGYLFNSYYDAVGERQPRPQRGVLTRPTVEETFAYRAEVDARVLDLLEATRPPERDRLLPVVELGLHHEQQHQELMLSDLLHLFASNPLRPAYREPPRHEAAPAGTPPLEFHVHDPGLFEIGHGGDGFSFDNERPRHLALLDAFALADRLVTNGELLEFIGDGGYERPELWMAEGWQTVQAGGWRAPLYWERDRERDGESWRHMTLHGMRPVEPGEPVCHVSWFEADAFARWAGARLPTEQEWESVAVGRPVAGNLLETGGFRPRPAGAAADGRGERQLYGDLWEWTASPYAGYPGFRPEAGALGEYNGKFMCNQYVLRGGSFATPGDHLRPTYRNFFPPAARWQFTGIRLARDL